jgi:hypothetical protein
LDYLAGENIETNVYPTGVIFSYPTSSNVYYMEDGLKRLIDTVATFEANNLNWNFLQTAPASMVVENGDSIAAQKNSITLIY